MTAALGVNQLTLASGKPQFHRGPIIMMLLRSERVPLAVVNQRPMCQPIQIRPETTSTSIR
ncbi:hypothetical protein [Mycolicibacterium neworleansense]|uniref:hypothetical protein n=1 Tax=Mycolicibacterium neworleansense TaxID=146018 RepID=UPI00103D497E|nr:hypothetical protein [Mycolicibacterium neworleansense]MCV7363184.1 hypothetical protein [Mycolicibacterium neworleansense]